MEERASAQSRPAGQPALPAIQGFNQIAESDPARRSRRERSERAPVSNLKRKEAAMAEKILAPAFKAVGVYALGALYMSWVVAVVYSAIAG